MITVTDLRKSYGEIEALKGISFDVPTGQIVGFLGPNGAGKSTTMKILTCFMSASSGAVSIDGLDAYENPTEVKARIGYLPESTPLYTDMIAYEYLDYVASMRGIASEERKSRIQTIARTCGISEFIGREIGTLSKGQRQRVGIAQALIHDPQILIMDEPTSGLDPNQIVEIRSLIRELGKDRTILLSTHNLPEVLETCDRLIIIHKGAIVADGTPQELEEKEAGDPLVILTVKGSAGELDTATVQHELEELTGIQSVTAQPAGNGLVSAEIHAESGVDIRPTLSTTAVAKGWTIYELKRDALDLEGIFRKLTQEA